MRRIPLFPLIAALALLTTSSATFGQATASGTIQGTVFDKSESLITGAQVVITSKATGATRTTSTSGEGTYRFDLLSAGFYPVEAANDGLFNDSQTLELVLGPTATSNITLHPRSTAGTTHGTA